MSIVSLDERRAAVEKTRELAESVARPDPVPAAYVVTEPGVYPGLPNDWYHRDVVPGGSLSHSGADKLLPPSTPAKFQYDRVNRVPWFKPEFDFGSAAHWLVLEGETGVREHRVDVYDFTSWQTKAAQEGRKASRAAGRAPVLIEQWERIKGMAAAIREHPLASRLFDPDHGQPEVSLFWKDVPTGTMLRCRPDWLPDRPIGGRLIVPDYKTTECASPPVWRKGAADYGYHRQDPWYCDGVRAVGLADDPAFVFVVQEIKAPFLVSVIGLEDNAVATGIDENRAAIDLYAACSAADHWPGYSSEVEYVDLPPYYRSRIPKEIA